MLRQSAIVPLVLPTEVQEIGEVLVRSSLFLVLPGEAQEIGAQLAPPVRACHRCGGDW